MVLAGWRTGVEVAHRSLNFVLTISTRNAIRATDVPWPWMGPVVVVEDHDHHHLARRGRADDHVARRPPRVALHAEPLGLVRMRSRDGSGCDQHLRMSSTLSNIPGMWNPTGRRVAVSPADSICLARQPAAVGEGEFEFACGGNCVSAEPRAGRDLRQLDLADARQLGRGPDRS